MPLVRSSPDVRVRSATKPTKCLTNTHSDCGNLAGVPKVESLRGTLTGTSYNTPAAGSCKTQTRRQKQETISQQTPLHLTHNSPHFPADINEHFQPRDGEFVRLMRKATAAASHPRSKTRSPSQTTHDVTTTTDAWVLPTNDPRQILQTTGVAHSAGHHGRSQSEIHRQLPTCVFPSLSYKASSNGGHDVKPCPCLLTDVVRQVIRADDIFTASKIVAKSVRLLPH